MRVSAQDLLITTAEPLSIHPLCPGLPLSRLPCPNPTLILGCFYASARRANPKTCAAHSYRPLVLWTPQRTRTERASPRPRKGWTFPEEPVSKPVPGSLCNPLPAVHNVQLDANIFTGSLGSNPRGTQNLTACRHVVDRPVAAGRQPSRGMLDYCEAAY